MGKCLTIEMPESEIVVEMHSNHMKSPTETNSETSHVPQLPQHTCSASRSSKKSQIRIDHTTLEKHIKGAMSLNQQVSVLYEEKAEDWLNIDTKLNSLSHVKHNNTPVDTNINHIDLQISVFDIAFLDDGAYGGNDNDPEIDPPSPLSFV